MDPLPTISRELVWCPRCGTIKAIAESGFVVIKPPTLVKQCRDYEEELNRDSRTVVGLRCAFHRAGVTESIRRQEGVT